MNINIERIKSNLEIIELEDDDGLTLSKKDADIKITIYEKELIEEIIDSNFNKKYRSLLYLISQLNEDDTTDTDTSLALIKIEELRNTLLKKYLKFLNKELLDKYLNMLLFLETKIPIINKERGR